MLKEMTSKILIRVAESAARKSVCKASPWVRYQPIESVKVKNWTKKNNRE